MSGRPRLFGRHVSARGAAAVLATVCLAVLLSAAPVVAAGPTAQVHGKPYGSKRLGVARHLPGGYTSRLTFTLRRSHGSVVTAYAVSGTRYFENYDFEGNHPVSRAEAHRVFATRSQWEWYPRVTFRYLNVHADAHSAKVLKAVYILMIAE